MLLRTLRATNARRLRPEQIRAEGNRQKLYGTPKTGRGSRKTVTSEADHESPKGKSNGKPPKQTAKNKQASHKKRLKVSEKENCDSKD